MPAPDARGLTGPGRFADVRRVARTDSTNARLLEAARGGAPEGAVLVADHQTTGRGRLGRSWLAPPGTALLVSVLLRPALPVEHLARCTMAAGLAAVDACRRVAGVDPELKWPNDLVVTDAGGGVRKLAGLLAESLLVGARVDAVVVGMGLNVRGVPVPELAGVAVALDELADREVDREALLHEWLRGLEDRYDEMVTGGVFEEYGRRLATLGRHVDVELVDGSLSGLAVDVTAAGALVVEQAGVRHEVSVGDVRRVRPSPGT